MGRSRREVAAGGKGTSPQVPPKAPAAGDALHPERQSSAAELGSEAFRGLPPGLPFSAGRLSLVVCGRRTDIHREMEPMRLQTLSLQTAKSGRRLAVGS